MKLKNLFWFATGASISYHLVKNRKEIKTEVTESSQLVKGIQDNLAKIQRNLDIIQDQKTNLQELVTDFQYKTKLFRQQATASLKEIQDICNQVKTIEKTQSFFSYSEGSVGVTLLDSVAAGATGVTGATEL